MPIHADMSYTNGNEHDTKEILLSNRKEANAYTKRRKSHPIPFHIRRRIVRGLIYGANESYEFERLTLLFLQTFHEAFEHFYEHFYEHFHFLGT